MMSNMFFFSDQCSGCLGNSFSGPKGAADPQLFMQRIAKIRFLRNGLAILGANER